MGQTATADTNAPTTAPVVPAIAEQTGFDWKNLLNSIVQSISKLWESLTSSGPGQYLTVLGRAIGNWFTGTRGDPVEALGINPPAATPANTPSTDPAAIKTAAQSFVAKANVLPSATNDTNTASPLPSGAPQQNESASNTRENSPSR